MQKKQKKAVYYQPTTRPNENADLRNQLNLVSTQGQSALEAGIDGLTYQTDALCGMVQETLASIIHSGRSMPSNLLVDRTIAEKATAEMSMRREGKQERNISKADIMVLRS